MSQAFTKAHEGKNQLKTDSHEYITVVSSEINHLHECALPCFQDIDAETDFLSVEPADFAFDCGFSIIIPLVHLPQTMQPVVSFQLAPAADKIEVYDLNLPAETARTGTEVAGQPVGTTSPKFVISWPKLLQMIYISGLLVAVLASLSGFLNILMLFRKVPVISKDSFRLLISNDDIPAFSLGRYLFISKSDFETNGDTILTHEKAHISHGHFYDLLLLEVVKIIYWFNPVIYLLTRDLKAVHEFQADDSTLNYGIDATQYQLLIIQKSVGHQKFALANSFNYCQIKNRIVMMNKQKSSKAWRWTAAAFIPMLALLLMAFGRTGENAPLVRFGSPVFAQELQQDSVRQWSEADFGSPEQIMKEPPTEGLRYCPIQIDSKSQIKMWGKFCTLKDLPNYVRKCQDYSFADEITKPSFKKFRINGQDKMTSTLLLYIQKDLATSQKDYQQLLNNIGNTILEIRRKYAYQIFSNSYAKLTSAQREDIDRLIPAISIFSHTPVLKSEVENYQSILSVEVHVEGIIVLPEKKVSSLEELKKKVEIFVGDNPKGEVILKASFNISDNQVNEVNKLLKDAKVSKVSYSSFDPVYVVVEEMPKFPGGEKALREWTVKNIKYPEKAKGIQGKVFVNFVINSEGKVLEAKIARGLSPSLDAEALRLVSEMPKWKPGTQKGVSVSVSYTIPITFSI